MLSVFGAFLRALRDLSHPRVVGIMFLPMLGSIALWTALAWYFWGAWTGAVNVFLTDNAASAWMITHGLTWMLQGVAAIFVIALVIAAALVTAMLMTELVAMPVIVSIVERQYAHLEKEKSASVIGSLGNALTGIGIFLVLWLVTLPLWLTGIGAVVLPALLSAYLNQRLFRYDALAEHASRSECAAVIANAKPRLYALGFLLALVYYVPLLNLIAPVLSGLAFTHLCLSELTRLRGVRSERLR